MLPFQGFGDLAALQRMLSQAAPAAAPAGPGPGALPAIWKGAMAAPGSDPLDYAAASAYLNPGPALPGTLASVRGQLAALAALNPGLLRALAYAPPLQAARPPGQGVQPAQAHGGQGGGPAAAGAAGQAAGVPTYPGWPLPGGPGPPPNGGAKQ